MLKKAQKLMADESTDRLIINSASVYVHARINVAKRQLRIVKFNKLLMRTFNDPKLSDTVGSMRMNRNECDYNPSAAITAELCDGAVNDAETILETCKNFVEGF